MGAEPRLLLLFSLLLPAAAFIQMLSACCPLLSLLTVHRLPCPFGLQLPVGGLQPMWGGGYSSDD